MNIKHQELYQRVDEVLYYVWDPIGVSDVPYARGEYWSYVPSILELVLQNDDPAPIIERLAEIISDSMEIRVDRVRCEKTARLLLEYKDAVNQGAH